MISLDVGYLTYSQIAKESLIFLNQNCATSAPIQIEKIIDINYGINIIPTPGLQALYQIDGFISSDYSSIYVDNFVYEQRYYRYRYTLAHEIGHLILHKTFLDQCQFNSLEEWKFFCTNIDLKDHSIMEYQGYCFGGLVLVPKQELRKYFQEYLPQIMPLIEQAKKNGIKRKDYLIYAKDTLSSFLSPIFEASTDVINRRIDFDSLCNLIP